MKKKVVVFGDLPIATKITKDLISRNDVNLIGVVLSKKNLTIMIHGKMFQVCLNLLNQTKLKS